MSLRIQNIEMLCAYEDPYNKRPNSPEQLMIENGASPQKNPLLIERVVSWLRGVVNVSKTYVPKCAAYNLYRCCCARSGA